MNRRGFTLIELLVVIGIIGLLTVIGLAVGHHLTGSGKQRVTENVVQTLDASIMEFTRSAGNIPPPTYKWEDPNDPGEFAHVPVVDGSWDAASGAMVNSVSWFMRQCERTPSAADMFKGLDATLVTNFEIDDPALATTWPADNPMAPTVLDAWGRPMRYVHPALDGLIHGPNFLAGNLSKAGAGTAVQTSDVLGPAPSAGVFAFTMIRRNNLPGSPTTADSDGGVCPGSTPYFYSAGADGDPSTTNDNVYGVRPKFEKAP